MAFTMNRKENIQSLRITRWNIIRKNSRHKIAEIEADGVKCTNHFNYKQQWCADVENNAYLNVDERSDEMAEGRGERRAVRKYARSRFDFKIDFKCLPKALNYAVERLKKYFPFE